MLENREDERARSLFGDMAEAKACNGKGGREAARLRRERRLRRLLQGRRQRTVVEELELLEAVQGGGTEEAVEVWLDGGPAGRRQDEAADGAAVRLADAGHEVDAGCPRAGAEAVAVEVERGGAPEAAPTGGEDLGAGAVDGGEEVDDVAQDAVGEAADAVGGSLAVAIFRLPLLPPRNDLHCRTGRGSWLQLVGEATRRLLLRRLFSLAETPEIIKESRACGP